ncbi:hypothetical protein NC653_037195 [Populus alba x Populus x berolinensis]|uniref:Uncharacterized protein n=1 Tax=Populus alba x Populus x berolinensis TaxID=444605 RepID=A0AAD6PSN8_9ROSI|nr:hypothetical protein NC653_037195 [Populus alba x Populus x berolinensis]
MLRNRIFMAVWKSLSCCKKGSDMEDSLLKMIAGIICCSLAPGELTMLQQCFFQDCYFQGTVGCYLEICFYWFRMTKLELLVFEKFPSPNMRRDKTELLSVTGDPLSSKETNAKHIKEEHISMSVAYVPVPVPVTGSEWSPVFLSKWHPSVQNQPLGLAILPVNIKEEVQDQSCLVFGGLGWVDFVCSQFRKCKWVLSPSLNMTPSDFFFSFFLSMI